MNPKASIKAITITTRTDGIWLTAAAMIVGVAAMITVGVTASEAGTAITPLMFIAAMMHVGFLIVGSSRFVATSSVPMIGAVMIESGFSDEPSWIRSIVLGCWWFVALELSWEAIDRRHGARYTAAATLRRVQEVVTVVGLALGIGLVASVATELAPARSVALQAVVLGGLLAAFMSLVRHVATTNASNPSNRG